METNRKINNNINNIKNIFFKKNRIIYPISKNKFNKSNSEYLKYKPLSNRFIYTKAVNKVKLKNKSIFSTKRKNHTELKNKINNINTFSKQNDTNNNLKKNTIQNTNNKKNIIDKNRIFSEIYQEETKKKNLSTFESAIKNKNKILYKNNRDNISYKEILKLWDQFIIPVSYRNIFNEILNQLEKEERKKLLCNEYDELYELKKDIGALLENIKLRKEIINQLKEINRNLKLIFKAEAKEPNLLLVKNMSENIEKMRNFTIKICFLMKGIKRRIFAGSMTGKFNIDLITQNFHFDKNYLIKMKEELNFLKEGNAKYFFNLSEDQSPFLIKSSIEDPDSKKDPFITIVPITEEIREKIDKCNYIIYQELIAYQNRDFNNNIFRPISPQEEYNNYLNDTINDKDKNRKIMNYSSLLKTQNKIKTEKIKPKKELEIKLVHIKQRKNFRNSILKSNSCINFQIKRTQFKNKIFYLTNLEKIKSNKYFIYPNNDDDNFEKN